MSARKHPYLNHARPWHVLVVLLAGAMIAAGWWVFHGRLHGSHAGPPDPAWIPAHPSDRWQCIVIHHSASDFGSADTFDKWHKAKGWDGLGYHFVIGNGSETPDGHVEVGFRWEQQTHGAHCKTPDEFYNQHGIGICLVGNFDNYHPTAPQMKSLVRLCDFLCERFDISADQIYTHGGITQKTDCPGKNFDVDALRTFVRIQQRASVP